MTDYFIHFIHLKKKIQIVFVLNTGIHFIRTNIDINSMQSILFLRYLSIQHGIG